MPDRSSPGDPWTSAITPLSPCPSLCDHRVRPSGPARDLVRLPAGCTGRRGPTEDIARVREGPEGPSKWQRIPEVIQALWERGCDSGGPEAVWKRSGARTKGHSFEDSEPDRIPKDYKSSFGIPYSFKEVKWAETFVITASVGGSQRVGQRHTHTSRE